MATPSTVLTDLDELVVCQDCGRPLGRYAISFLLDRANPAWGPYLPELTKRGWLARPSELTPEVRPESGHRTGTGLTVESWDGEPRVRLRCKCGRNQPLNLSTLQRRNVATEDGERVVRL